MTRADSADAPPSRRERRSHRTSGVLDVLSASYLMVLGILVLCAYPRQDLVGHLLLGGVLAVLVAWLPMVFLPVGVSRHQRARAGAGPRSWLGVLAAAGSVGLGLAVGLWWQAPRPAMVLSVASWGVIGMTVAVSRWKKLDSHTAVAGVVSGALAVQRWPWGAGALVLVLLVGGSVLRHGHRSLLSVLVAGGLGLLVSAGAMVIWG